MAKNKSVAQTVNLQSGVQTPKYKVAASQVDTFVKQRTAEQILAQDPRTKIAENIDAIIDTGSALVKKRYEKQLAELDTTASLIQKDLDEGTIKKLEESQDYSSLPETLRIRVAHTIGRNDANKIGDQIRDEMVKDPSITLDPDKFNKFLSKYNIDIDAEDGFNIHRQAVQASHLESIFNQLRGEARSIRSTENQKTLIHNAGVDLGDHIEEGLKAGNSVEQILSSLNNDNFATAGLLPSQIRDVVSDILVKEATLRSDSRLLDHNFLPTYLKDPTLEYLMKEAKEDLDDELLQKFEDDEKLIALTKTKQTREVSESIQKRLDNGAIIDVNSDEFKEYDPELRQIIRNLINSNDENQVSIKESDKRKAETLEKIRNAIKTGEPIVTRVGDRLIQYDLSEAQLLDYLNTVKINQTDRREIQNQIYPLIKAGDITTTESYSESLKAASSIINEDMFNNKALDLPENVPMVVNKLLQEVMEHHDYLYREVLRTQDVVNPIDKYNIINQTREFAKKILQAKYSEVDFGFNNPLQGDGSESGGDDDFTSYRNVGGNNNTNTNTNTNTKLSGQKRQEARTEAKEKAIERNKNIKLTKERREKARSLMTNSEKKKFSRTGQISDRVLKLLDAEDDK